MAEQQKPQKTKQKSAEEELSELKASLELPEPPHLNPKLAQKVYADGDLLKLTEEERLEYYEQVCASLKLNPLTRPFEFILQKIKQKDSNGKWIEIPKLILYAKRDCTDQLRKIWNISVDLAETKQVGDTYNMKVIAYASNGRKDFATGSVPLNDYEGNKLSGEKLANAMMKAETKAKRRATLSICGLGFTDESEFDTMQGSFYPSTSEPPSKPTKADIIQKETQSNPATSQPKPAPKTIEQAHEENKTKLILPSHADGMPSLPVTQDEMASNGKTVFEQQADSADDDAFNDMVAEETEKKKEELAKQDDLAAIEAADHEVDTKPIACDTFEDWFNSVPYYTKDGVEIPGRTKKDAFIMFKWQIEDGPKKDGVVKTWKMSIAGKFTFIPKSISYYRTDLEALLVPVWYLDKPDNQEKIKAMWPTN